MKHPLVAEAFNIVGFHLPPGSASRHEVTRVFFLLVEIGQNWTGGREDNAGFPRPSPPASLHRARFEALLKAGDQIGLGLLSSFAFLFVFFYLSISFFYLQFLFAVFNSIQGNRGGLGQGEQLRPDSDLLLQAGLDQELFYLPDLFYFRLLGH